MNRISLSALMVSWLMASAALAGRETRSLGDMRAVGTVSFPTSCDAKVQADFSRGVALLHSFFYQEARRIFTDVAERDQGCAIALWGIAMTYYHPLWAPPTDEELKSGLAAVEKAKSLPAKTDREREFIHAIETFYRTPQSATAGPTGVGCHGPMGDHAGRALAYANEMEKVYAKYPKDLEVAVFYSLSLLGSAPPTDKTLANQMKAAGILEKLWTANRNHPGIAHYLIHSYDYPSVATKGLPAAKAYAGMAPWVSHALHMPSHIFTRLGMWKESIDTNIASADAARAYAAKYHPDAASFEEFHALDYLVYGYLQTTQDDKAKEGMDRIAVAVKKTYPEVDMVVAYAAGAIPARFALERRQWKEAASLPVPPSILWKKFPFAEAHLEFAHAIGRARSGDLPGAKQAVARLKQIGDSITDPKFQLFHKQVDAQTQAATAWVQKSEGKNDDAIALLRKAADQEDTTGKHPVSPGAIYPVRELLGDLLLELHHPAEALTEYEAALKIYPQRFTGLYGAGSAAEAAGKGDLALTYYKSLLALAKPGKGPRPELEKVRAFVEKKTASR